MTGRSLYSFVLLQPHTPNENRPRLLAITGQRKSSCGFYLCLIRSMLWYSVDETFSLHVAGPLKTSERKHIIWHIIWPVWEKYSPRLTFFHCKPLNLLTGALSSLRSCAKSGPMINTQWWKWFVSSTTVAINGQSLLTQVRFDSGSFKSKKKWFYYT